MTPVFAPAFPWIASGVAALLGLLGVVLSVRVIMNRVRLGIEIGDGGQAEMAQVVRAHANFAEHAPLALILLILSETTGSPKWLVLAAAALLVIGRALSAIGLSRSLGPSISRQAGASATLLAMMITCFGLGWSVIPWILRGAT